MILVLIHILITVVVAAIVFWIIDKYVRDRRLANLLKLLVILVCLAAILQRLLPLHRRGPLGASARHERTATISRSFRRPGQSNIAGPTPRAHAKARMQSPRAQELFGTWAQLAAAPFQGITTDGHVQPGLFSLAPQEAPTPAMVEAVDALLALV